MTRLRDLGRSPGVLAPGPLNAITDVAGVLVGQVTLVHGTRRTGVTAILPHGGDLFHERVPAGLAVANGHGKLAGSTQLEELGELETPIVLVNTLSVGRAIEAVVDWTLARPGAERVTSVNAVVAETNDGELNAIRARGIERGDILAALDRARGGPVEMGSVGAGAGTTAFGFKAGIGSSSRVVEAAGGRWTVGALVQANHAGVLRMDGVAVGRPARAPAPQCGSIVVILATDAPLSDRNLRRLALRGLMGVARTGADFANGSGDYAIAFSSHPDVRRHPREREPRLMPDLPNGEASPLFLAAIEAVEEAVCDSMIAAQGLETTHPLTGEATAAPSVLDALRRALAGGPDH